MEERFQKLESRLTSLESSQQNQTAMLTTISSDTRGLVEAWKAAEGAWKLLETLSKIAKTLAPIFIAFGASILSWIAATKVSWKAFMEIFSK